MTYCSLEVKQEQFIINKTQEKFEYTKGKGRQSNGHEKKDKKKDNHLQTTTQKSKD